MVKAEGMQAQWQAGDSWGEDGAEGELGTLGKPLKEWDWHPNLRHTISNLIFIHELWSFYVIFISQKS